MDLHRQTSWKPLPTQYLAQRYSLGHCNHLDWDQVCNSPFHGQALRTRKAIFTSPPLYRFTSDTSEDNAMSPNIMYRPYQPSVDFQQNWNSTYELTPPESLYDNDFIDSPASAAMNYCHGPQTQFHSSNMPLDTLDPRTMMRPYGSCSFADSVSQHLLDVPQLHQSYGSPPDDYDSPLYLPAMYQEQNVLYDEDASPTATGSMVHSPPPRSATVDDDNETSDKPYAKLIYEALMQTPGHKMMLRDIYDWFIVNTTKPQESGTNGWQNSIRHNLSMNQAFENDRNNSTLGRGHSRKANSVWMLTAHAVEHGVQSTTRYRKLGHVKKGASGRTPAIERQQSGARGGRATRKCAMRSKREDDTFDISIPRTVGSTMPSVQSYDMGIREGTARPTPRSHYVESTPVFDAAASERLQCLPGYNCPDGSEVKIEDYTTLGNDAYLYDTLFNPRSEQSLDDLDMIKTA